MPNDWLNDGVVLLRAPEPEDLEAMYALENDPHIWSEGITTAPYSRYALRKYIQQVSNDIFTDRQLRLMIVRQADGIPVGTADLIAFDPLHERAEVGIALLADNRGKGLGRRALALLCRYAFEFLHLHQLFAYVAIDNEPSLRMFRACGFTREVKLCEWLSVPGKGYRDVLLLQCFATEI